MIDLRKTIQVVHNLLEQNKIPHALIGGVALACYGSTRATIDVDLLIQEENKNSVKKILQENKFNLRNETEEVLQFSGVGYVDFLIAGRPLSREKRI